MRKGKKGRDGAGKYNAPCGGGSFAAVPLYRMQTPSFHTGAALLAAALFLRMLGVFILLPVAAPLVAALPDGGYLSAGLVLGGYGLTQAAMQVPVGALADKYGKKPVMLGALAVFAAGGLAASLAESAAGMVAGRLLQGAGAVAAITAAWIAEIAPPDRRAPAMALFGVVIALAFLCALFAAPAAAAGMGLDGVFALSGWLGAAAFGLRAAAAGAAGRLLPQGRPHWTEVMNNEVVLYMAVGAFVLHFALAVVFFVLPTVLPLPPEAHWQVYAPALAAAAYPAWWLIKRVERHTRGCLFAAVTLIMVTLILIPAASKIGILVAAPLGGFFIGFLMLEAAIPALTARAAPAHTRASAMGIVMSCQFAGIFFGGFAAGALAAWEMAAAPFLASILVWMWGRHAVRAEAFNARSG